MRSLRRRLHCQHPPPAATTARGATILAVQRSGAERTGHRWPNGLPILTQVSENPTAKAVHW
jgi:hypothetical protein